MHALVPLPPAPVGGPVDELTRILSLPRRPVYDCELDASGRYAPATQALIEIVTARFARAPRVSCACRPRQITRVADGLISIFRVMPEGFPVEAPKLVELRAFLDDNRNCVDDLRVGQRVAELKVGEVADFPAAGGSIGHPCILELNPAQSWTLHEAAIVGGVIGFKGVGSGKTVTGILAPLLFPDARLAVLCIEPKQRLHYRSHYFRLREHFRVPSVVFDDGTSPAPVPGTVPLHLMSYSRLSRTESSDRLDDLNPTVLILDEAHRACGDSAINRRVKRFSAKKIADREAAMQRGERVARRALYLLDWSGTLESKGVQDTQMLSTFSLGTGSPLPTNPDVAVAWSGVMDASRQPDRGSTTARRLHEAFGEGSQVLDSIEQDVTAMIAGADPERSVRRGFQKWRAETLGVITASALDATPIYISAREPEKMPQVVKEALRTLRVDKLRPDGEEIAQRLDEVTCAREIGCGFYTYWAFPNLKCECGGVEPRCAGCLHIDDWFRKRKAYTKELRSKLAEGEVYLDSPELCRAAAERFWQGGYTGKLPTWASEHWPAWCDIMDTVVYVPKHKWIGWDLSEAKNPETHPGYFLARDAAKWAKEERGIVWFRSVPLGRKIAELSGLPYFNGGPGCEERLAAEKGDRSIICSIKALGAGIDGLQHNFGDQLITECPASNGGNEGMEQLLGRLSRKGQIRDVVNTLIYQHTTEFRDAFRQARTDAEWDYDMKKIQQRLRLADIDFE